jgi:diguanylate cyclase (GGDEF)-like protein
LEQDVSTSKGPPAPGEPAHGGIGSQQVLQSWPVFAAGLVGVTLSISAWIAVSLREDSLEALEFSARANSVALILQDGIGEYTHRVEAVRALFQASETPVIRSEYVAFTGILLHDQKDVMSVSWIPRVTREQREEFERAAVSEGLPGYRIKSIQPGGSMAPSPDLREHFPILYSSNEKPGSPVYGLNLNDGGARQQTLERARDSNRITFSSSLAVIRGVSTELNFFLALPVYGPGLPHDTAEERRNNLVGFVQGLFQTGAIVKKILASATTPSGMDLYFYPPDASLDAAPIYVHASRLRTVPIEPQPRTALAAGRHWSGEIKVGDGRWAVIAVPIPEALGAHGRSGAWLMLAAGLLLTTVVAAYIWTSRRYAQHLRSANKHLDQTLDALKIANEQSRAQTLRFDTALNNMSHGLIMFDASERLVVCNDRYLKMYGLSRDIVKRGCTLSDLLQHRAEKGQLFRDPEQVRDEIRAVVTIGKPINSILEAPDGRVVSVTTEPMASGGWVTTHEDITERREAQARISHMALHDALTNLPNRMFFREQMEIRLAQLERGQKFAVLCFDLDQFKTVNDTLGHPFGDELLRQVSDRVRSCLREGDTIARLGGDEFAVLQGSINQPTETTALAARLIEVIGAPFDLNGHQAVIGASVGIAVAPSDASDPDQLLKNADLALYRAKKDGGRAYRFFEPEMDALMQTRRALELDLRKALVNGEFELYYQPLVNIESQAICGFEALLRWHHPERGLIPPGDFIPLAEETALIVPIGEWVLRQACEEAARWPRNIDLAVNLSPVQFKNPHLCQLVMTALARSGLESRRLELEITESVLLLNSESTLATLHRLRGLGVRISMDDFGTGYSSLSYLRSFPFDKIKIDRSFVHDLASNPDSMAIIRAVTSLGTSLGMTTTGEGVETQEELDYLKKEGCTQAQGYFYSRPKPATEISAMLASQATHIKAVA